ncbi:hypothetical protein D9757_001976 [Collybiopsis confluens]|uniref:UDP-N-acetylglucosamine transferase subunit ALG13 n=1 Tax=Collybiopsis confluens TaxID=2823264 RepID=A0A8H5MEF0_9AGAR|nr:hypothetical protein D9757_001976 [Collybiopsis confluens]
MLAFVTVGSTRFDELVQAALSSAVLSSLRRRGYTSLIVQRGNSVFPYEDDAGAETLRLEKNGVHIECWKFKPSLQTEYEKADIVISHAGEFSRSTEEEWASERPAGSGTIVDVLRMNKPLIVVPNPTLLDNHQQELADALDEMEHLKATNIERLSQTILEFNPSVLVKFPPFEGSKFRDLVDEEMGFV